MTKIAFIFPGQGSQKVGMGAELVANNEACKAFYDCADQALNFKLSKYMLEGPQEELTLTYHAQPALLTTGVMIASKLMEAGINPDYTAGHSLGEYGSFVIAESLSFEDAVKIVHKRGLYMNEAVPAGQGAMAAILGMEEEPLKEVCAEITEGGDLVQLANLNCPGQIVISGTKAGVEKASQLAKQRGAKRAISLEVSGPFHCELMKPAALQLEKEIEQLDISEPKIPVISNVHAELLKDAESIKKEMVDLRNGDSTVRVIGMTDAAGVASAQSTSQVATINYKLQKLARQKANVALDKKEPDIEDVIRRMYDGSIPAGV